MIHSYPEKSREIKRIEKQITNIEMATNAYRPEQNPKKFFDFFFSPFSLSFLYQRKYIYVTGCQLESIWHNNKNEADFKSDLYGHRRFYNRGRREKGEGDREGGALAE